jgi:hypothetical protein
MLICLKVQGDVSALWALTGYGLHTGNYEIERFILMSLSYFASRCVCVILYSFTVNATYLKYCTTCFDHKGSSSGATIYIYNY